MKGLGSAIKSLRKRKDLTLVEVAEKTGIDQATLSRIENGVMTGTLNSHMRIADVLGIPLPQLYEEVMEILDKAEDKNARKKLDRFTHSSGTVAELLTSGVLRKKMLPVLLKLKPKGYTESEEHPLGTERFIYVLKGAVRLEIEGEDQKTLEEKESFYFTASKPHTLSNKSSAETHILSVVSPASL